MSMELVPTPLTKHKRDPAWKHCHRYEIDDKVQLKCIYCEKLFKGGGIHRMKEHLAGHRTNASTCPRTPPDVRQLMQQSLDGENSRKKRKTPANENENNLSHPVGDENEHFFDDGSELNNTTVDVIPLLQISGLPEHVQVNGTTSLVVHEEEMPTPAQKTNGKKKRGRPPKDVATPARAVTAVRNLVQNGGEVGPRKVNDQVLQAIGRFFYDAGLPPHAVKSVHFQRMLDVIAAQGPGVSAPSYNDLRGRILKNSFDEIRTDNEIYMSTLGRTGCSILVDQWDAVEGTIFVNFLVSCPERTMFLKSVDVTEIIESVDALFELLKEVVEEVGAGHVVQVITNEDVQYAAAGKKLTEAFPMILSNTCATRGIHMILEDFGKLEWIDKALEQAKYVARFVYNRSEVLNMVRTLTFGHDLVVPGVTHSATNFATLKRFVDLKQNLESMVNSRDWVQSPHSKQPGGLAMVDIIGSEPFWYACTQIVELTDPLLRLLRIVNGEKRSPMAYISGGMYRVKETIKKHFSKKEDQDIYLSIVDHWWQDQWKNPLHAAGFYLNPKFFFSMEGDLPKIVVSGMLDCVEKLVPDATIQDKVVKELAYYKSAAGDFGRKMAIRARDTLLPVEWWSTYGGACPNLSRLAIRILSQSCSIMGARKNQILFKQLTNTKNCIEHRRMSDFLFVHYNLQLARSAGQEKGRAITDPISVDNQSVVQEWVAQTEVSFEDHLSTDWVAVEPPPVDIAPLAPQSDDLEYLGKGFNDNDIFSRQNHTDENIQDNQEME